MKTIDADIVIVGGGAAGVAAMAGAFGKAKVLMIEKNSYLPSIPNNQEWLASMRFQDYDGNGKLDFFSAKCTNLPVVRWEVQNGKLIRIN